MIALNILLRFGFLALVLMPFSGSYRQPGPFTSFEVELNGAGLVNVRWSTLDRTGNVRFEIERSREQKLWNTITVVSAGSQFPYSFMDAYPDKGINYYRIKQVDPSGQYFLSPVKEIYVNKPGELSVWPNPVNDVLHIRTSFTNGTIDVIDVSGRILHKKPVGAFTTDVPVGQLPNGIYFVRVRYDNSKQAVAKFVKN